MGKYSAADRNVYENRGGGGFRIAKDGEKVRVIFLYEGPESIDGWSIHRFYGKKGFTYNVDCPRGPKDPLEKCPMCEAGEPLSTRLFVRLLNLNTGKVELWDRAANFRQDLVGYMGYFNPLYKKVYEITRHGSGLDTKYQFQSLDDSGITPEQYQEYLKQAEEAEADFVLPVEQYLTAKSAQDRAQREESEEQVNVGAPQNNAWAAPPTNAWGAPPAQGWGAPPAPAPTQMPTQMPQQNWSQPAAPQPVAPQQPAPPTEAAPQQPAPQGWGAPPAGNWGQPPQGWNNQQ